MYLPVIWAFITNWLVVYLCLSAAGSTYLVSGCRYLCLSVPGHTYLSVTWAFITNWVTVYVCLSAAGFTYLVCHLGVLNHLGGGTCACLCLGIRICLLVVYNHLGRWWCICVCQWLGLRMLSASSLRLFVPVMYPAPGFVYSYVGYKSACAVLKECTTNKE